MAWRREEPRRPRLGIRYFAAAAAAVAGAECLWTGTSSSHRVRLPRSQPLRAASLDELAPPDIGQPNVPELRSLQSKTARVRTRTGLELTDLPPDLERIQRFAANKILEGLRLGMHCLTAVLPLGLGDGAIGAHVIKERWRSSRILPFRALVAMPEAMLDAAEKRYAQLTGSGLFVLRVQPSNEGTDEVVEALQSTSGLVVLCSYKDISVVIRGSRRCRNRHLDLAIFEMANAGLGIDPDAELAVMKWEETYRDRVLQSVYVSSRSLEANPVASLEEAIMEVPGTPSYTVIANAGGLGGPEVYSMKPEEAQEAGITVPLRLLVLSASSSALLKELAELQSRGVTHTEVVPHSAGGASAETVKFLNDQVQNMTDGACKVTLRSGDTVSEIPDALLIPARVAPDLTYLLQAFGRLSFNTRREAVYILVMDDVGPATSATLRVLAERDARVDAALQETNVARGKKGKHLVWEDLSPVLQDLAADHQGSRDFLLKVLNSADADAADSWDVMLGHLEAYMETLEDKNQQVPVDLVFHGVQLGKWVAKQYMEWRFGQLDDKKQERLIMCGLSVEEEGARFLQDGLVEFKQYMEDTKGDPFVDTTHITTSGFPLGVWANRQRAAWKRKKLSASQMYELYNVGFGPAAYPEAYQARQVTIMLEQVMRQMWRQPLPRRRKVFKDLVKKYHPEGRKLGVSQAYSFDAAIKFLDGFRDWFLNPPAPPLLDEDDEDEYFK